MKQPKEMVNVSSQEICDLINPLNVEQRRNAPFIKQPTRAQQAWIEHFFRLDITIQHGKYVVETEVVRV